MEKKTRKEAASGGNVTDGDSRGWGHARTNHTQSYLRIARTTRTHALHIRPLQHSLARVAKRVATLFTWPGESMRPSEHHHRRSLPAFALLIAAVAYF